MKMSDVFGLPVGQYAEFGDMRLRDIDGYLVDVSAYSRKHAALCINMHDNLVDAVEVLLLRPDLADREFIAELLSRAKGEIE